MFRSEIETDRFDKNQVHYWLTQGDSCGIISTPKDSSGTIVAPELISQVKFKLFEQCSNIIIYEKEMSVYSTNKYLLNMLSSESTEIPVGRYGYEIEYTLEDGGVNTTNQWLFDITPQGLEV